MGVLNLDDQPQPPIDNHKFKTQETLKTSTLFDKELVVDKIKFQVGGMRWSVDYFNQILNVNTQPLAPDIGIPGTTLKYNRIDKLDIFVDSGLPSGVTTDIVGTGVINAGFLPYVGDAFTATLAGGRIGIFVLTAVRKEYYNSHDIYAVDYKLTYFVDTAGAMYNDLVFKTVRVYVYDKDAVNTNSMPVLLAKDYKRKIDISKEPAKLMSYYVETFLDPVTKYLALPTLTSAYVDQLVASTVFKTTNTDEVMSLRSVSRISEDIHSHTIWDAILNRDPALLEACNRDIKFSINAVGASSSRNVQSYLGVTYLISDTSGGVIPAPSVKINPIAGNKTVATQITNPDTSYIFSAAFYAQDPNTMFSSLETCLLQYIRGEVVNRDLIDGLLADYIYWDRYQQYYLIPILNILVTSLINNTYSSL